MDENDLRQLFAKVFNLDASTVTGEMNPDTVAGWDSFGHMRLITAVETALGTQLRMEQIIEIDSFESLCRTVATARAE
jgi:acyl carrier protein